MSVCFEQLCYADLCTVILAYHWKASTMPCQWCIGLFISNILYFKDKTYSGRWIFAKECCSFGRLCKYTTGISPSVLLGVLLMNIRWTAGDLFHIVAHFWFYAYCLSKISFYFGHYFFSWMVGLYLIYTFWNICFTYLLKYSFVMGPLD